MIGIQARAKRFIGVVFSAAIVPAAASGNVVISSAATENMICQNGVCVPTASMAVLNITDLETLLANGNVEVTTTGSGVQAGGIEVNAPLTWSSSSALSLDAYDSIRVEKPVTVSGAGGLSVVTNDGGSGGVFYFGAKGHVSFTETSSVLSINGTVYTLVATLPALASAIAANPSGSYALEASYRLGRHRLYRSAPITTEFEGNFNGLGNTISNLKISSAETFGTLGLFRELDTSAVVASLRMAHINIQASPSSAAGGIAAGSYGTIFNSYVTGIVVTKGGDGGGGYLGGTVGVNDGTIDDVASDVEITLGTNEKTGPIAGGGLAGASDGIVEQSFSTGSVAVTVPSQEDAVGGLLGINGGIVENSYANASSSESGGRYANVGGLIGINDMFVSPSYSTGTSSGGSDSHVGGLIGYDDSQADGGSLTDTYWDTTTSGIINLSQGAGNIANDPGIKGKTTDRLQSKLPKGFDRSIWAENPKINSGLPYLIANPPLK